MEIQQKKVKEFINQVLISDIGKMIETENYYLSFGVIAQGIELLGAIIENEDSKFEDQGLSRKRFYNALKLFSNPNYIKNCSEFDKGKDDDYDLYTNLRCGYAHIMLPTGKINVTTQNPNLGHLETDTFGILYMVCEEFYKDFKGACEKVIKMIDKEDIKNPKARGNYLVLRPI